MWLRQRAPLSCGSARAFVGRPTPQRLPGHIRLAHSNVREGAQTSQPAHHHLVRRQSAVARACQPLLACGGPAEFGGVRPWMRGPNWGGARGRRELHASATLLSSAGELSRTFSCVFALIPHLTSRSLFPTHPRLQVNQALMNGVEMHQFGTWLLLQDAALRRLRGTERVSHCQHCVKEAAIC